jgi:hypothetical protein
MSRISAIQVHAIDKQVVVRLFDGETMGDTSNLAVEFRLNPVPDAISFAQALIQKSDEARLLINTNDPRTIGMNGSN